MPERSPPPSRALYPRFDVVGTRWMDNDAYGHVNNVVYYSYFDTVINRFLIGEGGLDIARGSAIAVVVSSACRYHAALTFPETIDAGMRVVTLGTSSVTWEVALFARGSDVAAADGAFVHVFVDRETRRPVPIPGTIRGALFPLLREARPGLPRSARGQTGRRGARSRLPTLGATGPPGASEAWGRTRSWRGSGSRADGVAGARRRAPSRGGCVCAFRRRRTSLRPRRSR